MGPTVIKVRGRSADLKISESALLSLNHQNFSNNEPIYTKYSFMSRRNLHPRVMVDQAGRPLPPKKNLAF